MKAFEISNGSGEGYCDPRLADSAKDVLASLASTDSIAASSHGFQAFSKNALTANSFSPNQGNGEWGIFLHVDGKTRKSLSRPQTRTIPHFDPDIWVVKALHRSDLRTRIQCPVQLTHSRLPPPSFLFFFFFFLVYGVDVGGLQVHSHNSLNHFIMLVRFGD
jgi:hypothetical protein